VIDSRKIFFLNGLPKLLLYLHTSKYLANAGFELQVDLIASLACFQLFMNDVYASITGFFENYIGKKIIQNKYHASYITNVFPYKPFLIRCHRFSDVRPKFRDAYVDLLGIVRAPLKCRVSKIKVHFFNTM